MLCRRRDSNSHTLRYTILSRARLPFRHSGICYPILPSCSRYTLCLNSIFFRNGTPSLVVRLLAPDIFEAKLLIQQNDLLGRPLRHYLFFFNYIYLEHYTSTYPYPEWNHSLVLRLLFIYGKAMNLLIHIFQAELASSCLGPSFSFSRMTYWVDHSGICFETKLKQKL